MLKNLLRNRRALSPIFATLIILAIVTVLFVPVFIWASGITSSNQESSKLSSLIATERIVIEETNIAGGQPTQTVTIYVRNIGETTVKINDVLISSTDKVVHIYQGTQIQTVQPGFIPTPTPSPAVTSTYITKGQLIQVNVLNLKSADNFVILNGDSVTIQVFTSRA